MLNSLRLNGLVVEPLTQLADALEGQGSLGPWYFAAFFVLWATVGLPVTPLEILCGFVFGAPRAVLVVTLVKLGGCVAGDRRNHARRLRRAITQSHERAFGFVRGWRSGTTMNRMCEGRSACATRAHVA